MLEMPKFQTRSSRFRIQPPVFPRCLQANPFRRAILPADGTESHLRRTRAIPKGPNPPQPPASRKRLPIRAGLRRNCMTVFPPALQPLAVLDAARLAQALRLPASTSESQTISAPAAVPEHLLRRTADACCSQEFQFLLQKLHPRPISFRRGARQGRQNPPRQLCSPSLCAVAPRHSLDQAGRRRDLLAAVVSSLARLPAQMKWQPFRRRRRRQSQRQTPAESSVAQVSALNIGRFSTPDVPAREPVPPPALPVPQACLCRAVNSLS